ncbi:MAG: rod shape-determining protein MreC [Clostridia bacterium]|nr:rod shape-determining protein MreC [Clostridia bacterium]
MRKKLNTFFTPKNMLIVLTVVCILFVGASFFTDKLSAPVRAVVSSVVIPMQKGMNNLGLWTYDKAETMKELGEVIEQNAELQSRIDSLVEENNQLKQDSYELERLRDLYELDEKYPGYTKVGARVIGKGSDNWFNTFTIDKGSKDGIEVDMNVIAGGGLVGIVTSVGDNYATVHSIIDDSSKVSGMLIDTGDNCIVNGDIKLMDSGLLRVQYFKKDVVVRDGDKIVTSNISNDYLEGILIGYIKDVTMDSNNLTQSGYLVPVVDFAHLQEVLVIKEKKVKP